MFDQIDQQIEHLRLDSDVFAVPPELAAADIQHMVGEDKLHLVIPERDALISLAPLLRGEGWGEGLYPRKLMPVDRPVPSHPDHICDVIRPLPASGAR